MNGELNHYVHLAAMRLNEAMQSRASLHSSPPFPLKLSSTSHPLSPLKKQDRQGTSLYPHLASNRAE